MEWLDAFLSKFWDLKQKLKTDSSSRLLCLAWSMWDLWQSVHGRDGRFLETPLTWTYLVSVASPCWGSDHHAPASRHRNIGCLNGLQCKSLWAKWLWGLWLNSGKLFSSTSEVVVKRQSRQRGSCNLENFGQNIKMKNIKFKAACFTPQSLSDRTDLVHLTLSSWPWRFHLPMSQVAEGTYCNVSTSVLEPFCSDDSTKTQRCQNPPLWGLQQQGVAGFAVQCFSDSCRICHLRVSEISAKQVNMGTIGLSKQLKTWTSWTFMDNMIYDNSAGPFC